MTIKHKEQNISIIITAALIIISAAVLIKQSSYDLSRYGIKYSKGKNTSPAKKVSIKSLTPAGFKPDSKTSEYDAETLYEKINGKAPLYLTTGFKKLQTRRFISSKNSKLWFELYLYNMGSTKNAFSVFSRQVRSEAIHINGSLYNYRTENSEIIVRDNYYIEIVGSESDNIIRKAIGETSAKIKQQLGTVQPVKELEYFKSRYLVTGSEKYYLSDAFGYKDFKTLYSAIFKAGKKEVTVFISGPFKKDEIEETREGYSAFLVNEGSKIIKSKSSIPGLVVIDFDESYETMFIIGNFLAGVHEADSQTDAEKFSEFLNDVLQKNMKVPGK